MVDDEEYVNTGYAEMGWKVNSTAGAYYHMKTPPSMLKDWPVTTDAASLAR